MPKNESRARLINNVRRRLGANFTVKNREIFAVIAETLGVPWDGTKSHGYRLANIYMGLGIKTKPVTKATAKRLVPEASSSFLDTYAWRSLRMRVIKARGAKCECCGATPDHGVRINVDHIKPRVRFPELALDESNLQVLCEACNHGKGNWDETDWRPRLVRPA